MLVLYYKNEQKFSKELNEILINSFYMVGLAGTAIKPYFPATLSI
jgi:hypothetical protein